MGDWKRHERGLHHVGPYWFRFFEDGLTGTVFCQPNAEGRFAWYVTDRDSGPNTPKAFQPGLASTIDEAKFLANSAVIDKKRGRIPVVHGELMTSTDRNRRRNDRFLSIENQSRDLVNELYNYGKILESDGKIEECNRIRQLLRRYALIGISDYARRAARSRVRSGSRLPSPEEAQAYEQAVSTIADELDALVDDPAADLDAFEKVANKLRQMGNFPDQEFYSAVVRSFESQVATE